MIRMPAHKVQAAPLNPSGPASQAASLSAVAPLNPLSCPKCGSGTMGPGIAMGQTMTGMPDFPHDNHAVTLSAGGPGYLMACLKCNACGYSRTPGAPVAAKQRDLSQIAQTNA